MRDDDAEVTALSGNRTRLAWMLTGCIGAVFSSVLIFKWDEVWKMKPNEWGDFLAGFASALAFVWLVVGYYQQNEDIKLQIHEIQLSVDAQQTQAAALQQERRAAKHQALPKFRFENFGDASDGLFVRFRNEGSPVDIVHASAADGSRCEVNTKRLGTRAALQVQIEGRPFKESNGKRFTVKYIDAQGDPGSAQFEIIANQTESGVHEIKKSDNSV